MPGDVGFLFPPKAKMRIPSLKVGIMASIYIKTLNKQIQMELSVNKVFVKKKNGLHTTFLTLIIMVHKEIVDFLKYKYHSLLTLT